MPKINPLKNVSIVLVDTKAPANIGSVARGMMNMGLSRLVLVRPPLDRDNQARKLAAGAQDILNAAVIYPRLDQAVSDQKLVIGASRHKGRMRKNIRTPRESIDQVIPFLGKNPVSFVFGNEVNGLDKADLSLCQEFISIPSSNAFPSLNLSHAVIIVAYELFLASLGPAPLVTSELAVAHDLENFYHQLKISLLESGFLDPNHPDRIMFSLRQIFGRARLEPRELNILRGIVTAFKRSY